MFFNTAFDISFSLVHGFDDPFDVPVAEKIAALEDRLQYLKEHPEEAAEAFGVCDTYDVENPCVSCLVVGTDSYGEPSTLPVRVLCSNFERERGNHLQAASKYALGSRAFQNAVVFDDSTPEGQTLLAEYRFIRLAPLIGLSGRIIAQPAQEKT